MSAFHGLKVLDCSQGLVGPMAAMLLADFGAEVLKVEPPGGDRVADKPGYQMWNRNKRRLTLDLDSVAGRERLEQLLAAADLAVFDFSPKRMQALDLLDTTRHPRLVRLWTPAYGTSGDWSEMEAHHGALISLTGAAFRQSSYEEQPVYLIAPVLHYAQACMAAGSAGAALLERSKSGLGQGVTVSGLNAVAMVGGASGTFLPPGRKPLGASPSYRLYECGDGEFLFLATLFSYFFKRALNAMGLTEIALAEEVFPEEVTEAMEARFLEKSRDEWLAILRDADVPVGPVGKREDWLASELIANNDMRVVIEDPDKGPVEMPGVPIKLKQTAGAVRHLVRDATDADVAAFLDAPKAAAAVGDAPKTGPLAGLKVLDLGTVIAGAYCNAILANLGAEVVKVESAEGDPWRDRGIGFTAFNRGKRGLVVDMKQPAGRDLFLDLARQADVVLDNYRLGVRDRLGIGHDAVRAANPRLISGSITTYGSRGEETKRPGFDPLLQARSGLMAAQGGGDGDEPVFHIIAVNDFASAAMTAFGVIAALNARERTGEGQVLETSLTNQSAMFQCGDLTTWPGAPAPVKGSRDCLGVAALDRFYAASDDWLLIACGSASEAAALATALGHPEWATDFDMMAEPRDGALAALIEQALKSKPMAETIGALRAVGVRATPAQEGDEVLADPWLQENHFLDPVRETPHGQITDRPYASFTRSASGYTRPDPGLGEHSFEVLADWGIDPDRIAQLGDDGVVMVLC